MQSRDVTSRAITVAPHIPFRILPSAFRMPQFCILPSCSVQLSYYCIGYMRSIAIQRTALDYILPIASWNWFGLEVLASTSVFRIARQFVAFNISDFGNLGPHTQMPSAVLKLGQILCFRIQTSKKSCKRRQCHSQVSDTPTSGLSTAQWLNLCSAYQGYYSNHDAY